MSTVEKSIRLYAWKTNYQTFQVVQGEANSRKFNIQLFSTTIPVDLTNCEVMFYAVKPDSTKVYVECEVIDAENGLASVTLVDQMCIVDGTVDCWVQVIGEGGTDLRFEGMNIEVSPCPMTMSLESSDDMRAFLQQSAKLAELETEVKNARMGNANLQAKEKEQDKEIDVERKRIDNIIVDKTSGLKEYKITELYLNNAQYNNDGSNYFIKASNPVFAGRSENVGWGTTSKDVRVLNVGVHFSDTKYTVDSHYEKVGEDSDYVYSDDTGAIVEYKQVESTEYDHAWYYTCLAGYYADPPGLYANFRVLVAYSVDADNTELEDIRVGADGVKYNSAGEAVRNQFKNIKDQHENDVTQIRGDLDDYEEQIGWVENNPPLPTNQWKWYNATFSDTGSYIESSKFIQMPEWEDNYIVDKALKFLVNDGYIFNIFIFNKKGAFNVSNFVGKLKENFDSNEAVIDYRKYKSCYYSVVLSKEDGTDIDTSECVNVIAYRKSKIDLPYVTPEMFGAKGDGVTNDGVALRLALNSGKKLIIPQKTYAFDYIEIPDKCVIEGCGDKSILKNSIENDKVASMYLSSNENIRIHLKGFTLLGDFNTIDGIRLDNTDGPSNNDDHWHTIENLHIEGFKNGLKMVKTRECRTVNCTIRNCVKGFYYDNCADGLITMCTASQNTENGFHLTQGSNYRLINNKAFMNNNGFYINQYTEWGQVLISCCEEQDNTEHGYYLDTSKNISISDCLGGGTPNAITIDGITGLRVNGHFMIRGTGHKVLNTIGSLKNAKIEIFTNNLVNEEVLYNFSETPTNTKLIIDMVEQVIN